MRRAEILHRRRASHAASRPYMNTIPEGANNGNYGMMDENNAMAGNNEAQVMPAAAAAPANKKKWANMTNEEKEAVRQAKIKTAKAKAARSKRIAAKSQKTRAARLEKEKENAKVTAAQKAEKRLAQKMAREARATKFAEIKDAYAARIAEAQALREAGNAAGADAMEDEIRRDIREEEEKELGPVGIEDLLSALGL